MKDTLVMPMVFALLAFRAEAANATVEEDCITKEPQTVRQIYNFILSKPGVANASEMRSYTNTIPGTQVSYAMVPIPAGEFLMGSPEGETGHKPDEGPQHRVKISPFWMGRCEVTWAEFDVYVVPERTPDFKVDNGSDAAQEKPSDAICRPSPTLPYFGFGMRRAGYPVINVTQHAANKYCEWLSAKTGQFYRLPTEAEWECACRAGTTTAYSFGDDPAKLPDYAWFEKDSDDKPQRVGIKKPNPWGLYDMHGNVAEWCLDQYEETYQRFVGGALQQDPWNKATRNYPHVLRGGSWSDEPEKLRSAARLKSDKSWKLQDPRLPKSVWYHTDAPFLGFRIVRPLNVPALEEVFKYWNSGVEKE